MPADPNENLYVDIVWSLTKYSISCVPMWVRLPSQLRTWARYDERGTREDHRISEHIGKIFTLIGRDGKPYASATPGTFGGHRRNKIYGRLDCAGARRWIARGHYVKHRVFFADEATAIAAGYRPCANCMPQAYAAWKLRRAG